MQNSKEKMMRDEICMVMWGLVAEKERMKIKNAIEIVVLKVKIFAVVNVYPEKFQSDLRVCVCYLALRQPLQRRNATVK